MAGENFGERRFTRTIWAHDGVNLTLINSQIDPLQNLITVDARM
jgi:hypothetical protein